MIMTNFLKDSWEITIRKVLLMSTLTITDHIGLLRLYIRWTMSGESMALKVINKINLRLKFLHRKNKLLTPALCRLLCNALIQPHFDYELSAWYPNLTQKMINKIQIMQNKCIQYCLRPDKMTHISKNEFETLNWLPVKDRFN